MPLAELTVWQAALLIVAAPFLYAIGHALLCLVVVLIDAFIKTRNHKA